MGFDGGFALDGVVTTSHQDRTVLSDFFSAEEKLCSACGAGLLMTVPFRATFSHHKEAGRRNFRKQPGKLASTAEYRSHTGTHGLSGSYSPEKILIQRQSLTAGGVIEATFWCSIS